MVPDSPDRTGARICPGRHFASATVWLSIVSVLATFNIHKKKDQFGKEIHTDKGYIGGLIMFVIFGMEFEELLICPFLTVIHILSKLQLLLDLTFPGH